LLAPNQSTVTTGSSPTTQDLATGSGVRSVWEDYSRLVARQDEWLAEYDRILRKGKVLREDG